MPPKHLHHLWTKLISTQVLFNIRHSRRHLDPRDIEPLGPALRVGVELGYPRFQPTSCSNLIAVAIGSLEFQPFGGTVADCEASAPLEKQRPGHISADALLIAAGQNRRSGPARNPRAAAVTSQAWPLTDA